MSSDAIQISLIRTVVLSERTIGCRIGNFFWNALSKILIWDSIQIMAGCAFLRRSL